MDADAHDSTATEVAESMPDVLEQTGDAGDDERGGRRLDVELLQEFGEIKVDEDRLRREHSAAETKRKKLEPRVREELTAAGFQRVGLERGITVYMERQLWAGLDGEGIGEPPAPGDLDEGPDEGAEQDVTDYQYEVACDALERAGLGHLVQRRFNTQSLSAHFRRIEEEAEEAYREENGLEPDAPVALEPEQLLPPELVGVLKLTEKFTAKAIKG
jgi:hypothetical protein